jgi:hypothetical protein
VEPVTPAGGATRVACEEDACWVSFFDESAAEGFLWTDESLEFRKSHEHFSHRQRPKPFGWLSVSPSKSIDLGSLSGVLQSFK